MKLPTDRTFRRRPFLTMIVSVLAFGPRAVARVTAPLFKVSLKDAHKGTLEVDTQLLDSFKRLPENIRSFYLESRSVFDGSPTADFSDPTIVEAAKTHDLPLMGGPMLGDLHSDSVTVWLRPAQVGALSIKVTNEDGGAAQSIDVKPLKSGIDQRVRIGGLVPNTAYRYEVLANGQNVAEGEFVTAPVDDAKGVFRVSFGSCCHKIGIHNPNLFTQIRMRAPHAMLILGDSAVDDREDQINMHRADYQLRDVSAPWRDLTANIPVYASWDDHDYFNNDLNGIPKRFSAADRDAVRSVWRQNWNNPMASDNREGIYFNTRIGPTEVIMLDTRSCRDNNRRNQRHSYLGEQQMTWLKNTLQSSTAPFKIISSGTMWSDYVSKAKDSWGSWDVEAREEIFGLIEREKIGGVLLISGDRHGARGFKIPRPSGFAFHEFEAATLGGVSGPAGLVKNCPEQLFGYGGGDFIACGEFTFDTSGKDPRVTFRLIDQSGIIKEEHTFTLQQLTPGI